jgi:hypothetical protein
VSSRACEHGEHQEQAGRGAAPAQADVARQAFGVQAEVGVTSKLASRSA